MRWRIKRQSNCTESQLLAEMIIIISRRRNWHQLENCPNYALRLSQNAFVWHELEDLTFLWSVNKLARSVTKWSRACDRRSARLTAYIHHTHDHRQLCHVGNTAQHCLLGFFQVILLETLKIPSQPRVESDVSSQVEHFFPHFVCARSKHQCLTVQLNLKLFLWTLVFTWTVSPLSISDIWLLKYCILLRTHIKQ